MSEPSRAPRPASPLQRILHRWLVEYNPIYLLSAMLVLGGMILCSRGLAHDGLVGDLGVPVVAELYAGLLIGGAALLTRIGQRRPAVMLALITALYQCDLTLHTETCTMLGSVGIVAAVAWTLLFVGKLYALAWAVRVRLSQSAIGVAALGGAGLALLPHLLAPLGERDASALAALWLFALYVLGTSSSRAVTSCVPLDAWGATVLRRALRAIWIFWSLLLLLHVGFWSLHTALLLGVLLPVALLVVAARARTEGRAWAATSAALVVAAVQMPTHLSLTALLAAGALTLRVLSAPRVGVVIAQAASTSPYRVGKEPEPASTVANANATGPATNSAAATARLVAGALFALYLAVWTFGWTGGRWPAHLLALDLALTAAMVLLALRPRHRIAVLPLAATYAHFGLQSGLIGAPRSVVEWGVAAVGLGFALLIASLAASYWLRHVTPEHASVRSRHEPSG